MKNQLFIEKKFREIKKKNFSNYQKIHRKKFFSTKKNFLFKISKILNILHEKKYSTNEWRILIGTWLNLALNIYFYNDYLKKYFPKKLEKIILSESPEKHFPPLDYREFFKLINTKKYQLYLLKKLILKNSFNYKVRNKNTFKIKSNFTKNLYLKIIKLISSKKTLFLIRSRFKFSQILQLILKSKFKILPLIDPTEIYNISGINYNKEKRLKFLSLFDKDDFDIAEFITEIIPSSYIENFLTYEKIGKKILKKPSKVYTDTAHLDDDLFKNIITRVRLNKNFRLLIGQHGGNHRIHNQYVTNYHDDYEICSKYLVWGKPIKPKEEKLSSIRLFNINQKDKTKDNIKYNVCYVFEALRKNQFQADFKRNDDYIRSLETKKIFLKKLKKKFIVRSYYDKNRYENQINDKKLSKYLDIKLGLFKNNKEVLFESNIIVLDYMSTMIFELISLNIPFVLILDRSNEYLSNFGKKFIKDLKKINLYFNNPARAVEFINNLPNDKNWWFEEKKQKKILKLKKNYAYLSKFHINDWYKTLKD